jgi:SAM-dependent methyltransferase
MPPGMTFKRRVLSALGKDGLLQVARRLELEVTTRMPVAELVDRLASSKRANVTAIIDESMSRDTLKEICRAVGLDDAGKEKNVLVARIRGAAERGSDEGGASGGYRIDPRSTRGSLAADRGALGTWLPGLDAVPGPKPTKAHGKPKRRRGGVTPADAVIAGTLKAALQQFALAAAGGYTGRDAHVAFTTHMLGSFGWQAGRPDGAEIPHRFSVADAGQRVEREVALWWPKRRALMEIAAHDAALDFAWKDLVRVCLQLDPIPQYVVLTNQRDLHLYDLARDREAPRLAIRIDDLPKYSEAFPFFTDEWKPGTVPRIVNVEKVSGEVADLVARLFRSVRAEHATRERDVIRFTLQCITAMFAEDIGLLPKNYFTSLLYNGAKAGDVERRLHELFTQMNTPDLPAPRVVPYFNGGLFTDVTTLPLGDSQVRALTKAAEANWTYVDPHIFGSVFQGIMNDAERHASGAHYTAHDDIMRVVGPTIVEPWRKRIQAATSLKELTELRKELFAYRVLDPACGSGNFLYVAFREMYRLDTEVLSRMREFPSTAGKLSWNGGIPVANFYGIDINPFAVELAKVTLNIAKKIAFEERKEKAFALAGQVEMDIDPSLPLDNLDQNIVCADALFMDWPAVDAIVSNPPFLGEKWLRKQLGATRTEALKKRFPGFSGDLCVYWFRRAHEHLKPGGRAGLVGPSNIRVGSNRAAALDYIVATAGTITNAVSERDWPGDAAVHVSMVNWHKGPLPGPHELIVDNQIFRMEAIPSHLQLHCDVSAASELHANRDGTSQGVTFGSKAFYVDDATAMRLTANAASARFVQAVANGDDVLRGTFQTEPNYCINLGSCLTEEEAAATGAAFSLLKERLLPEVRAKGGTYQGWPERWWQPWRPRREFLSEASKNDRIIACSRLASRPIYFFLRTHGVVPMERLQLFALADDYSFGILQSTPHWEWRKGKGGRLKADIVYAAEVWRTFPWPQDPTDEQVTSVATFARKLLRVRADLMKQTGWSLRALYQAADVEGAHPLKDVQAALDAAVGAAYGVPDALDPIEFLLELNELVSEDEGQGRRVRGPGLPEHLDPADPRWTSTDCIEPPPVGS